MSLVLLGLILTAVVATDLAVGVLYLSTRRRPPVAVPVAAPSPNLPAELDIMVKRLRTQADQALTEIGRQKTQLRQMLADIERGQTGRPVLSAVLTRKAIVRMAGEGHSLRAIAARTGASVEEVRLLLASDADREPALESA